MNKQLFLADTQCQLSLKDMIEKTENSDDQITYYYNKNYIIGKTTQCEIFDGRLGTSAVGLWQLHSQYL